MIETLQFWLIAVQAAGTMLAVGLELSPASLRATLAQRRALGIGVLLNLGALPLLAVALLSIAQLPASVTAGLLLAASCAGGNTAVLLTRNVQGDAPYAVTMLCVLNLLALPVLPPLLGVVSNQLGLAPLPASTIATLVLRGLLLYMICPLVLGMAARALRPALAARWAPRLARVANICLVALVLGLLAAHGNEMTQLSNGALAIAATLVVFSFGSAIAVARPGTPLGRAALHVGGIRNLSLALVLAALLQLPPLATLSVLAYGLLMYIAAAVAWLLLIRLPSPA